MRLVLNLTIDGEPFPKQRPRLARKRGVIYTPQETVKAERAIATQLKSVLRGSEPDAVNTFGVELEFYCRSAATDLDNLTKLVLDSCNKVVWRDDRQVEKIVARLTRRATQPRTILRIFALPPIQGKLSSCQE